MYIYKYIYIWIYVYMNIYMCIYMYMKPCSPGCEPAGFIFFFVARKPRVERYTKPMSLTYEPASEPLHISVK